jgi:flagellum-specific peptidoglycan hydrolase FlgJ
MNETQRVKAYGEDLVKNSWRSVKAAFRVFDNVNESCENISLPYIPQIKGRIN